MKAENPRKLRKAVTLRRFKKFPKPEHGYDTALTYEQELEVFEDEVLKWQKDAVEKLEEMIKTAENEKSKDNSPFYNAWLDGHIETCKELLESLR